MKIVIALLTFALILHIAPAKKVVHREKYMWVEQLENETCDPYKTWTEKGCTRRLCNSAGTHITTEICQPPYCEPSEQVPPQPSEEYPKCCTSCDSYQ